MLSEVSMTGDRHGCCSEDTEFRASSSRDQLAGLEPSVNVARVTDWSTAALGKGSSARDAFSPSAPGPTPTACPRCTTTLGKTAPLYLEKGVQAGVHPTGRQYAGPNLTTSNPSPTLTPAPVMSFIYLVHFILSYLSDAQDNGQF